MIKYVVFVLISISLCSSCNSFKESNKVEKLEIYIILVDSLIESTEAKNKSYLVNPNFNNFNFAHGLDG
jgi:hypothetical protein